MKKLLGLGFAAVIFAGHANAGFIRIVTGADMAGIEVTAVFPGGLVDVITWQTLATDAGVPDLEGFSGGASGRGWELTQQGDTISENLPSGPGGIWTLNLIRPNIASLMINLMGDFVFDTEFGNASANGSGAGRKFASSVPMNFSFGGLVQDELYTTLTFLNLRQGTYQFVIDIDKVDATTAVSAPASLALLGLTLLGLAGTVRRKKA